jgi:hypothetical protein
LVGLFAVRDGGSGAASEHDRDAGGERALEGLLHQTQARVPAAGFPQVGLFE